MWGQSIGRTMILLPGVQQDSAEYACSSAIISSCGEGRTPIPHDVKRQRRAQDSLRSQTAQVVEDEQLDGEAGDNLYHPVGNVVEGV